jgi:hypothetical protein
MPTGVEHVEAALECIQSASEATGKLADTGEGWSTQAVARLEATGALLRETVDRFYLKTKVGVPFARRCEEAARALQALLAELIARPAPDAQERLDAALETLEKAAKTLDERSQMKGMAIT